MFCWLIRVTVVLWLWHFGCLCQLIVNELPRFLCETCSLCWAVECHNWWLLVLQLGNCPKAQNPVLVLQSKIHSCANIARKAKTVGFPPHCVILGLYALQTNTVSNLTGLPVRYSCWAKNYRAWVFCVSYCWVGEMRCRNLSGDCWHHLVMLV